MYKCHLPFSKERFQGFGNLYQIRNYLREIESGEPWKATTTIHQRLPIGRSSNKD